MKAITLWQPWASLWLSPAKVHETRHWSTPVRGTIAVHAAKRFLKNDLGDDLISILEDHFGIHWPMKLPTGALLGTLNLVDVLPTAKPPRGLGNNAAHGEDYVCGDWNDGRFAWKRGAYHVLKTPIPYVGRQGWFDVDDALLKEAA